MEERPVVVDADRSGGDPELAGFEDNNADRESSVVLALDFTDECFLAPCEVGD